MSKNQKIAFWAMFIGFCITATATIYPQGAFENPSVFGAVIFTLFYLVVAFFIYLFVKSNAKAVEKWFQK